MHSPDIAVRLNNDHTTQNLLAMCTKAIQLATYHSYIAYHSFISIILIVTVMYASVANNSVVVNSPENY